MRLNRVQRRPSPARWQPGPQEQQGRQPLSTPLQGRLLYPLPGQTLHPRGEGCCSVLSAGWLPPGLLWTQSCRCGADPHPSALSCSSGVLVPWELQVHGACPPAATPHSHSVPVGPSTIQQKNLQTQQTQLAISERLLEAGLGVRVPVHSTKAPLRTAEDKCSSWYSPSCLPLSCISGTP